MDRAWPCAPHEQTCRGRRGERATARRLLLELPHVLDGGDRTAYRLPSESVPGLKGHLLNTSTAAASNERCSRVGPEGLSISAFATRPDASIVKRMRVVPVASALNAALGYSGFSQEDTSMRAGVPKGRGTDGGAGGAMTTGAGAAAPKRP